MPLMIPPELPSYNDSLPLPSYSCELANGEQRLDYTPRSRAERLRPSGVFIKTSGELSVVLNGQEEDATIPVFGRRAVISGTILLCQRQLKSIREIVLKVEGRLDSAFYDGGRRSIKLIGNCYTLWSHLTSQEPCLPQIQFSITLPSTFQDGDHLPPSYHVQHSVPYLLVQSAYQLRFIVTRVRHQTLNSIWPKKQCIIVPFKYVPRTAAPQPMVNTPCLFSSVKTSPEEWHQTVTCLRMRPNVQMGPIICHLFVPAGRIYGLTDTVKFHVQLTGLAYALHTLFSGTDHADSVSPATKTKKSFIRVILLRQVSVVIREEKSFVNITLGEGTIWPIPPDLSSCSATCRPSQCRESNIDWEGEVRCRSDVTVGGFNAANVQVKDFIVVSISPPTLTSSLLEHQVNVPVKLVTDSFSDSITQMDSAVI